MAARRPAVCLDHVVLEVRDPERALAFYQGVLGLEPVRAEAFRAGRAPFPSVRVNAQTILDLFPPRLWRSGGAPENPNHLCLTMSQAAVAALRRRLARRAIPIVRRRARNFGAQGWGRSIYIADPDGARIEVRYYPR